MENTTFSITITENETHTKIIVKDQRDAYILISELIKTIERLANNAHENETDTQNLTIEEIS